MGVSCQGLASLHRVLSNSAYLGDSCQVYHIRGDITVGEGRTYQLIIIDGPVSYLVPADKNHIKAVLRLPALDTQ